MAESKAKVAESVATVFHRPGVWLAAVGRLQARRMAASGRELSFLWLVRRSSLRGIFAKELAPGKRCNALSNERNAKTDTCKQACPHQSLDELVLHQTVDLIRASGRRRATRGLAQTTTDGLNDKIGRPLEIPLTCRDNFKDPTGEDLLDRTIEGKRRIVR